MAQPAASVWTCSVRIPPIGRVAGTVAPSGSRRVATATVLAGPCEFL
jgi:hypothetical protein